MIPTVAMGDAFEFIRNGMNVKQDKNSGGLPITRIETISDGTVDLNRVGYAGLSEVDVEKWILEPGDILLSHINSVEHIGKSAIFEGAETPVVHGMNLLGMRPKNEVLFPRYAMWALKNPQFKTSILRFVNKAVNQASISTTNLKTVEIPLPPLEEQKRIAQILDQADTLRRLRTRALDKLNTLGQAIFHEMFGDRVSPQRLAECMRVQDALASGQLEMIQDGNHGERHPKVSDFSDEGTPFIMANCLGSGELHLENAYCLSDYWLDFLRKGFSQPGDVLLSHKGTLGETAIVPETVGTLVLSPQVTFYRPGEGLLAEYLQLFFRTEVFQNVLKKEGVQSTRAYIGLTRQKELPLFIPGVEEQAELIRRITGIQGSLNRSRNSMQKLETLFASLQYRAFRGEL